MRKGSGTPGVESTGGAGKNLEGRTPAGANAEAAPIAASSAIVRMFSLYDLCRFVVGKSADMV